MCVCVCAVWIAVWFLRYNSFAAFSFNLFPLLSSFPSPLPPDAAAGVSRTRISIFPRRVLVPRPRRSHGPCAWSPPRQLRSSTYPPAPRRCLCLPVANHAVAPRGPRVRDCGVLCCARISNTGPCESVCESSFFQQFFPVCVCENQKKHTPEQFAQLRFQPRNYIARLHTRAGHPHSVRVQLCVAKSSFCRISVVHTRWLWEKIGCIVVCNISYGTSTSTFTSSFRFYAPVASSPSCALTTHPVPTRPPDPASLAGHLRRPVEVELAGHGRKRRLGRRQ